MDGDDLRLSLSLGVAEIDPRDAMHPSSVAAAAIADTEAKSSARGIDVNLTPALGGCGDGDDVSSSSPRNLKRRSVEREENGGEKTGGGGGGVSDEEEGEATRKKLRLSKEQSAILEESFKEHNTLNPVKTHAMHAFPVSSQPAIHPSIFYGIGVRVGSGAVAAGFCYSPNETTAGQALILVLLVGPDASHRFTLLH